MSISRRQFIKYFGAAAATAGLLGCGSEQEQVEAAKTVAKNLANGSVAQVSNNSAHIVVVGGGIGGVALAKYLRLTDAGVKITIIEPNSQYTFCPGSNEVFNGHETIENLTYTYKDFSKMYSVDVIQDKAENIDYDNKSVKLASGKSINFDKLVVSTGPDFIYEAVEGYNAELAYTTMPHAWKAGEVTNILRDQIDSMPQGGVFVMSSPDGDYRCPPAPYERASMIAEHLEKVNPTAKIIILDSKNGFTFDKHYWHYWKERHGYGTDNARISWIAEKDGGRAVALDAATKTITTEAGEKIKADVINIIPPHKASKFADDTGLSNGDRWVDFEAKTFQSKVHPDVFVIGDMVKAPMSKTGFIASNQAKVVAQAIVDQLAGREPGTPFIANNCVAIISEEYGMTIADTHRFNGDHYLVQKRISEVTDNPYHRRIRAELAKNWQRTFRKDIFG